MAKIERINRESCQSIFNKKLTEFKYDEILPKHYYLTILLIRNMSFTIQVHKTIALLSFIVMLIVQLYLIYNTYKLADRQYFVDEKSLIKEDYLKSIRSDIVYPGGRKIVEQYLFPKIADLEYLYKYKPSDFKKSSDKLVREITHKLQQGSANMDTLFAVIIKKNDFKNNLRYLLTVEDLSISFQNSSYISIMDFDLEYGQFDLHHPNGFVISGNLNSINKQNLVTTLTVDYPATYSYQIAFSLYVDHEDRRWNILKLMMPTLVLSLFSILFVVIIYYVTFRNWLRQKKLTEMRSDFINSITHEFHTPLSTIMVANKSLQNDKIVENKEQLLPLTKVIERQALRLKTLFTQVLDITKMNKSSLKKDFYQLNDLLDEILLDYRLKLANNNTQIEFIQTKELGLVELDRFWFTTMLFNVFDNAIKYNNSEVKQIIVKTAIIDGGIALSITDNGVGMTDDVLTHIFEKFYRANHQNTSVDVKGLGLGLFYTKQCIDAHGWIIKINSTVGMGTKITILIG